ncbi:MAG: acyl-CoA thioesterase [Actinomycetota bacterium]|nr:acyl-CoA thioesterase [Actinomycetota bacterium]
MGAPFRHRLRVRYHECDPQGIVFNANFLTYADIAITELYREAFGGWQAPMDEHGIDMVVAEANVRYLAPLRFDEELELVASLTRIGETSTTTLIAMERGGDTVAEVEVRHVVVGAESRRKAPIPDPIRETLGQFKA